MFSFALNMHINLCINYIFKTEWYFFKCTVVIKVIRKNERNEMFYLTMNSFYLWLYGFGHMVKDHSDRKRGNPLLFFPINNKDSFICTIPQTG